MSGKSKLGQSIAGISPDQRQPRVGIYLRLEKLEAENAKLKAALKLARIPFAASLPRRSDRDEAERELAQIDALLAAGQPQGSGK